MTESGNIIDNSWNETLYREEEVVIYVTGPTTVDAYRIKYGDGTILGTYTTYTGYPAYSHTGIWFDSTLFDLDLNDDGECLFDMTGDISTSSGGTLQKSNLSIQTPISITTDADYENNNIADPFYFFDSTGTVVYTLFLSPSLN